MTQVQGYDDTLEAILRMRREDPDLYRFLELVMEDCVEVDEQLEMWR